MGWCGARLAGYVEQQNTCPPLLLRRRKRRAEEEETRGRTLADDVGVRLEILKKPTGEKEKKDLLFYYTEIAPATF